jgi:hypothetical protein
MKTSLATIGDFLPPHYSYRAERVEGAGRKHEPRKLGLNRAEPAEIGLKARFKPLVFSSKRAAKGKTRVLKLRDWRVQGSWA